ncbi:aspartate kinase [Chryseobacterium sp. SORGH_AS_1175]|uniref:aspartate kinase n=1 Tax=Chryseobacterium sp. SORGH_AS_1175 TaxID=3041760 RepID=UPI00285BAF4C|nr:aspartate kinase [Chryseobacterium sp. SORGH_AS_1175]MDR6129178.1 aspartate kinase [Chryseobacterium sp. SORGH_AS_1175]
MKVLKFGGTSVANAENIVKVGHIIKEESIKNPVTVIVSALHGVTDQLIQAAESASRNDANYLSIVKELEEKHLKLVRELIPVLEQSSLLSFVKKQFNTIEDLCNGIYALEEFTGRIKDKITSYGEFLSSNIIAARLKSEGLDVIWMDAAGYVITNSNFTNAKVDFEATEKNLEDFFQKNQHRVVIAPGFVASDKKGNPTTLGRGGSDYTASIIAAAADAEELQIWTDVSGMMTADPRLVSAAKPIPQISYAEAMETFPFWGKSPVSAYAPAGHGKKNQPQD